MKGGIINGYLRLYCWIKRLPLLPKRCRKCEGELDKDYKRRGCGLMCLECYRKHNRERAKAYQHKHPERVRAYNRLRYKPKAARAWIMAGYQYPDRRLCSISGCLEMGIRHHPDYDKPKEIVWLCPVHHKEEHRNLTFPSM